jgi:isoaspartyl peptidase/L-asparaginase-like protein (Ntn-hydrolase superfamily)
MMPWLVDTLNIGAVVFIKYCNSTLNLGRGSALTERGQVEMDALFMEGDTINSGDMTILPRKCR